MTRSLGAILCIFLAGGTVSAQEKVTFASIDGVELNGVFYQAKSKKAPVVLLLHALGESSSMKPYQDLAEILKEKFCVLAFDFRGHGQSVTMEPAKFNKFAKNVSAKAKGSALDFKKFEKSYFPVLVNDIAAARAWLERQKNDEGDCNVSNIVVIGCDTGATLGAIWLNSEAHRYKYLPAFMFGMQGSLDQYPEGKDISAAIWLSISPTLGSRTMKVGSVLEVPGFKNATPINFVFAKGDVKSRTIAGEILGSWKKTADNKERLKNTGTVEVGDANNKLVGSNLLAPSLKLGEFLLDELSNFTRKGNEWRTREFRKNYYVWSTPQTVIAAKALRYNPMLPVNFPFQLPAEPEEGLLFYNTYEMFIPLR